MSDSRFQRVLRAWHASPHEFDEFQDPETIKGKGQGAAAYGAGIYVAESPKVSGPGESEYMQEFSRHPALKVRSGTGEEMLGDLPLQRLHEALRDKRGFAYGDARSSVAKLFKVAPRHGSIDYLREALNDYFGDAEQREAAGNDFRNLVEQHKNMHEDGLDEDDPDYKQDMFDMNHLHKNVMQHYRRAASPTSYELAMTLDPHELLDWDARASEQPHVLAKARATIEKPRKFEIRKNVKDGFAEGHPFNASWTVHNAETGAHFDGPHFSKANAEDALQRANDMSDSEYASIYLKPDDHQLTGSQIYQILQQHHGSDIAASKALLKQGIKGIKYLDGASRVANLNRTHLRIDGVPAEEVVEHDPLARSVINKFGGPTQTIDQLVKMYDDYAKMPSPPAHPSWKEGARWLNDNRHRLTLDIPPTTHNYVIFDPKVIKILAKYDIKGEKLAELPEGRIFRQVDHDPFATK